MKIRTLSLGPVLVRSVARSAVEEAGASVQTTRQEPKTEEVDKEGCCMTS